MKQYLNLNFSFLNWISKLAGPHIAAILTKYYIADNETKFMVCFMYFRLLQYAYRIKWFQCHQLRNNSDTSYEFESDDEFSDSEPDFDSPEFKSFILSQREKFYKSNY